MNPFFIYIWIFLKETYLIRVTIVDVELIYTKLTCVEGQVSYIIHLQLRTMLQTCNKHIYMCLSINVIFFLLSPHHFLLSFSSPRASLSFPSFPLLSFPHSLPFLPFRLEWAKGWAYLCSAFSFLFFLSLSFFFLSSSIGPIDRPRWPSLISCLLVFENAYVLKIVFFCSYFIS